MKFDGFPGEKVILSFQLVNGNGWLTTDRIVLQHEKYSRRFKIVETLEPEMYLLQDF